MGAYKAAIVTEGGQNLIAQALADNKTLMFTSAKTSSYAYPSGTNIAALTGLRDIVQSVIPSRSQVLNDNVAQVTARFDNDGITQQYLIQTIGLYAQIENDPEILFSIAQAITPDEMPVHSNVSPSAFVYNIHHTVQNAAQIIITVNPAGTATVADIWSIEDPEFDDSGIVEGITSFPDLLDKIRSKMNIFQFYRDLKAGLRFVLHAGQLVNNCTSGAADLPLAAAQGKALWDKITAAVTALTTHKSSGDHDGRYYTESEINNLLNAKLSISNIVNNLTSTATNMALSAAQGKALNDKINSLNGDLAVGGWTTISGTYFDVSYRKIHTALYQIRIMQQAKTAIPNEARVKNCNRGNCPEFRATMDYTTDATRIRISGDADGGIWAYVETASGTALPAGAWVGLNVIIAP